MMTTIISQEVFNKIYEIVRSYYQYNENNDAVNDHKITLYNEEPDNVVVVITTKTGLARFEGKFKNIV